MALVHLLRRHSLLRHCSRTFCQAAASAPESTAILKTKVPLPVVPPISECPWASLTPSGRLVFPKDLNEYTTMDFLKSFDGYDAYHPKLMRRCRTFKDFLLVRVKVLKKLKIPREHRKKIIRFTHRFRMGTWKPKQKTGTLTQPKPTTVDATVSLPTEAPVSPVTA